LVTITGGKWTTYRKMAEDTVNAGIRARKLPGRECQTRHLKIHGYKENPDTGDRMYIYGSDLEEIQAMQRQNPAWAERLNGDSDFTAGEVIWAVRKEMARTVDDVLARRVRVRYLDARKSIATAPKVAEIMAAELGRDRNWVRRQVEEYTEMANGYVMA